MTSKDVAYRQFFFCWAGLAAFLLTFLPDMIHAQNNLTGDPVYDYAREMGRYFNPDNANDAELLETVRLLRFQADFNADGVDDIAVSDSSGWGANSGGEWCLYLKGKDGRYCPLKQRLFFHPLAIHVESIHDGRAAITCYHRENSRRGFLVRYALSEAGIKEIGRRVMEFQADGQAEREYEKLFGPLYRKPVSEYCLLADYLKDQACEWKKGY